MTAKKIPTKTWNLGRYLYGILLVAAVLLSVASYFLSVRSPLVNDDIQKVLLLRLTVLIPVIAIWMIAARGARQFKEYAVSISDSADGKSMNYLANGLLLLVAYIVVINFASPVVALTDGWQLAGPIKSLANHTPVTIALVAAIFIYAGSQGLVGLTRGKFWTVKRVMLLVAPYTILMLFLAIDFYQGVPDLTHRNGIARFNLPAGVLLFTYFLPHAAIWLLGMVSAANLAWYAKNVQGAIYKALFTNVYQGITLVYLAIFCAQLLISSPAISSNVSIASILVYGTLMLAIAGYVLLYRGAVKLQKVEGVK